MITGDKIRIRPSRQNLSIQSNCQYNANIDWRISVLHETMRCAFGICYFPLCSFRFIWHFFLQPCAVTVPGGQRLSRNRSVFSIPSNILYLTPPTRSCTSVSLGLGSLFMDCITSTQLNCRSNKKRATRLGYTTNKAPPLYEYIIWEVTTFARPRAWHICRASADSRIAGSLLAVPQVAHSFGSIRHCVFWKQGEKALT